VRAAASRAGEEGPLLDKNQVRPRPRPRPPGGGSAQRRLCLIEWSWSWSCKGHQSGWGKSPSSSPGNGSPLSRSPATRSRGGRGRQWSFPPCAHSSGSAACGFSKWKCATKHDGCAAVLPLILALVLLRPQVPAFLARLVPRPEGEKRESGGDIFRPARARTLEAVMPLARPQTRHPFPPRAARSPTAASGTGLSVDRFLIYGLFVPAPGSPCIACIY